MPLKKEIRSIVNKWIRANSGRGFTKFPPARWLYKILTIHLKPKIIEINGYKMYLDKEDVGKISVFGEYELFETEVVKKQIKKGMTVLNIGAYIGYYTLLASRLVGEKGKVFAFEPDPANFKLLKKNIKLNNSKNIKLIQKAASDKKGKQKLFLSTFSSNMHSLIYNEFSQPGGKIDVEVTTIDDYFKDYKGKIDFIIMDIEGAEPKALEGMSKTLNKNKKIKIIMELIPYLIEETGTNFKKFINSLQKSGFKVYKINEQIKKLEPLGDIDHFLRTREEKVSDNFLFVRN